jgi:hypothetical protein
MNTGDTISFGHLFHFYRVEGFAYFMTVNMQAYCGLDCSNCPAWLGYVNDDDELRQETVKKWTTPQFAVTMDTIDCAGCKSDGPHFSFCHSCNVRLCASKRGVETCAHCDDYGCDVLEDWLSHAGEESRKRLETIRNAL